METRRERPDLLIVKLVTGSGGEEVRRGGEFCRKCLLLIMTSGCVRIGRV